MADKPVGVDGVLDDGAAERLRAALLEGDFNGRRLLLIRQIEAWLDLPAEQAIAAFDGHDPAMLNDMLILLMAAQRRALAIPDGPGFVTRLQALAAARQGGTLAPEERRVFDRNMLAAQCQAALAARHPELSRPPTPDPQATTLRASMEPLQARQAEASAHAVPGAVTQAWLDELAEVLGGYRALLGSTSTASTQRSTLLFFAARAASALGRGLALMRQPGPASRAHDEAARLYAEGGEAEPAEQEADEANRLRWAATADVDRASLADLQRIANGIADPLARARALVRLSDRAGEANDAFDALTHAEAAAANFVEAGFPSPKHPRSPR